MLILLLLALTQNSKQNNLRSTHVILYHFFAKSVKSFFFCTYNAACQLLCLSIKLKIKPNSIVIFFLKQKFYTYVIITKFVLSFSCFLILIFYMLFSLELQQFFFFILAKQQNSLKCCYIPRLSFSVFLFLFLTFTKTRTM